jgi:hypothetical protein
MNPVQATRQGGHRALAALRVLVRVSPEQRCTRGSAAKVRPGVCAVLLSTASSVTNGSRCHSCCQSAPARTKEPTHARTQRSAGQCNWGGGKLSPIPPIVLAGALKRLCADHQDCLVGFVLLVHVHPSLPPSDLHPSDDAPQLVGMSCLPVFAVPCGIGRGHRKADSLTDRHAACSQLPAGPSAAMAGQRTTSAISLLPWTRPSDSKPMVTSCLLGAVHCTWTTHIGTPPAIDSPRATDDLGVSSDAVPAVGDYLTSPS